MKIPTALAVAGTVLYMVAFALTLHALDAGKGAVVAVLVVAMVATLALLIREVMRP